MRGERERANLVYERRGIFRTKVQTLGELRMRGTANRWAGRAIGVYPRSPASTAVCAIKDLRMRTI